MHIYNIADISITHTLNNHPKKPSLSELFLCMSLFFYMIIIKIQYLFVKNILIIKPPPRKKHFFTPQPTFTR